MRDQPDTNTANADDPSTTEGVGPIGRTLLTGVGLAVLVALGIAGGASLALLAWAVGTVAWLLLLVAWPSGPIRQEAVRRGPLRTALLAPMAFPFGIGMALWAAIELLGAFGI